MSWLLQVIHHPTWHEITIRLQNPTLDYAKIPARLTTALRLVAGLMPFAQTVLPADSSDVSGRQF